MNDPDDLLRAHLQQRADEAEPQSRLDEITNHDDTVRLTPATSGESGSRRGLLLAAAAVLVLAGVGAIALVDRDGTVVAPAVGDEAAPVVPGPDGTADQVEPTTDTVPVAAGKIGNYVVTEIRPDIGGDFPGEGTIAEAGFGAENSFARWSVLDENGAYGDPLSAGDVEITVWKSETINTVFPPERVASSTDIVLDDGDTVTISSDEAGTFHGGEFVRADGLEVWVRAENVGIDTLAVFLGRLSYIDPDLWNGVVDSLDAPSTTGFVDDTPPETSPTDMNTVPSTTSLLVDDTIVRGTLPPLSVEAGDLGMYVPGSGWTLSRPTTGPGIAQAEWTLDGAVDAPSVLVTFEESVPSITYEPGLLTVPGQIEVDGRTVAVVSDESGSFHSVEGTVDATSYSMFFSNSSLDDVVAFLDAAVYVSASEWNRMAEDSGYVPPQDAPASVD